MPEAIQSSDFFDKWVTGWSLLVHAVRMHDHQSPDIPEIFAGSMQLQPVDDSSECGAIAALGSAARKAQATWVASDAISAKPRAYVALIATGTSARVASAPGIVGDAEDARVAADVVRRYATTELGLAAS